MQEKVQSLRRAVVWGMTHAKTNLIVNLDVLAALLHIGPVLFCQHGVVEGNWCKACNVEYKIARAEQDPERDPS